ncbi:low affinity iron permease family protein [Novosphingobium sp. JCM 18896]|uniref:low affinity iron permease family protein n=1 Tax=Novosphingobium sp. JCM 18896 TaxID=2989731 RepID=UPI0022220252|nr:low affinity iron permease family protein [Novosphingobium sp. JCM 18896]MCW1430237.1 low affinity iron permease family protein [Novosphingobium sp. JCM 18896]
MIETFHRFAKHAADAAGSPWAFLGTLVIVAAWLALGPVFRFSDSWQLTINTACSIVPTLMVFLIQNSQNRDSRVLQLKLDAVLADAGGEASAFVDLENLSSKDIERVAQRLLAMVQEKPEGI